MKTLNYYAGVDEDFFKRTFHANLVSKPLLVLDLDGTVRHGKKELGHFVNSQEDVVIFPEALVQMRRWKDEKGGRIIAVSNQGGIAFGHMTEAVCYEAMMRTHQLCGNLFDLVAWCPHYPAVPDPQKSRCWCRKPSPGMVAACSVILSSLHGETYPSHLGLFVGDREEDSQCAAAAGLDFQHADDWRAEVWVVKT